MQRFSTLGIIAISTPLFAVAGAISRFSLKTTETRWQIAAFFSVAFGVEMLVWLIGSSRASLARGVLNGAVAAFVIVAVKYHLEPTARTHANTVVRRAAKELGARAAGRYLNREAR